MNKNIKNFLINISIFFAILILCFFILEIFARFYFDSFEYPQYAYKNDPYRDFKLAENFDETWKTSEFTVDFKTNSYGLRDIGFGKKKPNEFRIIFLGDSFIFGQGVNSNDSLPKKLEQKLNENKRENDIFYTVINAGIPGYGTDNEYNYLLHGRLFELEPDLVMLGFYEGNDFQDNLGYSDMFVYRGYKVGKAWKDNKFIFLRYLLSKSRLITNLYARRIMMKQDVCKGIREGFDPSFSPYILSKNDDTRRAYNVTEELLINTSNFLNEKKISFVIFTHGIFEIREKMPNCIENDNYNSKQPYNFMKDLGDNNNFKVISIQDELLSMDNPLSIYLKKDGHWNEYGNDIISGLLKQKLYDEKILKH